MSTLSPVALPEPAAKRRTRKPKAATPANPVMTPEMAEALTPAVTPVTPAATPAMATPGAYTDADLEALVGQYHAADKAEKECKDIVRQAKISFEDTRVLKSIVIWKVAMLEPYNGAPNATFAAKHLRMTAAERAALTPAQLKTKASSLKKAFTYYIRAGVALDAAGLALNMETVDQNMRDIVREAFKRTEDDTTSTTAVTGAGKGEGEGGTTVTPAELPDALTVSDLLAHVSRLQATLALMVKSQVPVSEAEAEAVGDTLTDFMAELTGYAAS